MAYALILHVACLLLPIRFAVLSDASTRSKCIVGGSALGSFLIPWPLAAILVQLAVSLYVLLYFEVFPPG